MLALGSLAFASPWLLAALAALPVMWWLILLRTVLAALVVLALAHPLLNPQNRLAGTGPVALVLDDGWAAARDWSRRQTAALDILAEAEREDRQIILVTTAPLASDEAPAPLQPV